MLRQAGTVVSSGLMPLLLMASTWRLAVCSGAQPAPGTAPAREPVPFTYVPCRVQAPSGAMACSRLLAPAAAADPFPPGFPPPKLHSVPVDTFDSPPRHTHLPYCPVLCTSRTAIRRHAPTPPSVSSSSATAASTSSASRALVSRWLMLQSVRPWSLHDPAEHRGALAWLAPNEGGGAMMPAKLWRRPSRAVLD